MEVLRAFNDYTSYTIEHLTQVCYTERKERERERDRKKKRHKTHIPSPSLSSSQTVGAYELFWPTRETALEELRRFDSAKFASLRLNSLHAHVESLLDKLRKKLIRWREDVLYLYTDLCCFLFFFLIRLG